MSLRAPHSTAKLTIYWTLAAVAVAIVVLLVRKSWALTTPQLWAEDGSVHLLENDQFGPRALFMPYRGYLHLLPRLIALFSSLFADVACWPALYNSAAFLVLIGVLARFASPRLDLPHKPLLVLSLVLVAHTNEVFFNITNLHWVTSFFLLQQILIARPVTVTQRTTDLVLTTIVGLTGPFVVLYFPFFIWRWWKDKHLENFWLLLVVTTCAGVQGYFIKTTGDSYFTQQSEPWHIAKLLTVASCRLVIWPLLGAKVATSMSWAMMSCIGVVFYSALLLWSLRPGPHRAIRIQVAVACLVFTIVGLKRIRPDTWGEPDIVNGDSYFYIPRVLLAWLLLWTLDVPLKPVRYLARGLCVVAVSLQLPDLREPPRPDYHWAEHCDPIRWGEPANIPILPEGWILQYRPLHRHYSPLK